MNNNILLIDDNACILETLALRIGLRLQDWKILTAENGIKGIEIMSSVPVSLVLTDIQMPLLDGYGVIDYRNWNYPHIPIIAMTGNATPEVRRKLLALHVYECFEKPFDFDKLFRQVASAVGIDSKADIILTDSAYSTQQLRVA